ncbi:MAG: NosD domain-containing protein [Candidatus Thorarchaeota archaeon]
MITRSACISVSLIVLLLLVSGNVSNISIFDGSGDHTTNSKFTLSDTTLSILNDNDFVLQGWPGNGTLEEPYVIEGLTIDLEGTGDTCIEVMSTTAHFVIRNCVLRGYTSRGIWLYDVVNGSVEDCNIAYLGSAQTTGIDCAHSSDITISNNTIWSNNYGIWIHTSGYTNCTNNRCNENACGILIESSSPNHLVGNYCNNNSEVGIIVISTQNNMILNNTCVENGGYYWGGGIFIRDTNHSIVKNNFVESTNVDGSPYTGIAIYEGSSHNYITNNTCSVGIDANGITQGIGIGDPSICNVVNNNTCLRNLYGISLSNWLDDTDSPDQNRVINNTITGSIDTGISLFRTYGNELIDNTILNGIGHDIFLERAGLNTINGNSMIGNGLRIEGTLNECNQVSITNNTVNNLQLIAIQGTENGIISGDLGQIVLVNCTNINIENASISNVWSGGAFHFTDSVRIYNSTFDNCTFGLSLDHSDSTTIQQSTFINCTYGLDVDQTSNNSRVELNSFLLNNRHAQDYGVDNVFEHNFWDDYSGYDIEGDGIGDSAYGIYGESNNSDEYPLMLRLGSTPIWLTSPHDQFLEGGHSFEYDLDATASLPGLQTWWLNDSLSFSIDSFGIITNATILDVANYGLQVWINDSIGNTITASLNIVVDDTTPPTWINTPSDVLLEFGDSFTYDLDVRDYSEIVSWSLNNTAYFSIDQQGIISNGTVLQVGIYGMEVLTSDSLGNTASVEFSIEVQDTISPMWIIEPTDVIVYTNQEIDIQFEAWDLSGISQWTVDNTVAFAITSNGRLVSISGLSAGTYTLTVSAFDSHNNPCVAVFSIIVREYIGSTTTSENTTTSTISTTETTPPPDNPLLLIVVGTIAIGVLLILYLARQRVN